eukprot:GFYU01088272.1.p2 GENE.GFYU01088272.1~~GFYU01088272.1.p2  ORF type:complete len:105 (+),score=29.95 GFYU01088272.1:24-317(+)
MDDDDDVGGFDMGDDDLGSAIGSDTTVVQAVGEAAVGHTGNVVTFQHIQRGRMTETSTAVAGGARHAKTLNDPWRMVDPHDIGDIAPKPLRKGMLSE